MFSSFSLFSVRYHFSKHFHTIFILVCDANRATNLVDIERSTILLRGKCEHRLLRGQL